MIRTLGVATMALAMVATAAAAPRTVHDFTFTSIDGGPLAMSDFAGRAVLVVNTASFCGFTRQYGDLQALWRDYRDRGLVVLGVPSNDFGQQEPGSAAEIKEFCEVNFEVDFPMTEKQQVVGDQAHPLFKYIVEQLGAQAAPRWNFHKYLVTPDGALTGGAWPSRVSPTSPEILDAIEAALPE
jgi:glutathione peroxidase